MVAAMPQEPPCGRPEGECCFTMHQARGAFTGEREEAEMVARVLAFVDANAGFSARAVYQTVRPRAKVLAALVIAEDRGLLRCAWLGPRRRGYWVIP